MLDCQLSGMALMSHPGSSPCIHSEIVQCKARNNGINSFTNTIESAKAKEIFFGLRSSSWSSLKVAQSWSSDGAEVGQKRGRRVTVAASPPTEDAVIATEPLTKEDLVAYLASGCKPKEKWRLNFKLFLVVHINSIFSCKMIFRIPYVLLNCY